ncbi:hypothetical protein M408DRAFT_313959, partial [Serendipita vermifera MAFF 305830]
SHAFLQFRGLWADAVDEAQPSWTSEWRSAKYRRGSKVLQEYWWRASPELAAAAGSGNFNLAPQAQPVTGRQPQVQRTEAEMSTVSGSTNYISGYIVEIKQELARKIAQLEDLQQLVLSTEQEVEQLKERSRSAHLQVDLDFTNLQGPREQIMDKLDQGFWKSSEEAALEDGDALLLEWLGSLDYDDILDQEFVAKCVPDHVFCLIDLIVGQDGRNMERWQSLKIAFPIAPELSLLIWPKLMRPTPSLSDIQFIHSVLREFQLVGKFSSVLEKIEFHFPTLEEFVLEWGAYVHVQTKPWLPAVHASRLRWNVGNTPIDLITDVSKGVLRTILHRYTNTKGLCVPAFVKTVLLGLLKEIFDDGILCNSWEVVSFHDMSGILETVRVKDIVGSRK